MQPTSSRGSCLNDRSELALHSRIRSSCDTLYRNVNPVATAPGSVFVSRKFRNSARLVQTEPNSLSGPGGMKCVLSCILFASALADTINLKGDSYACLHG